MEEFKPGADLWLADCLTPCDLYYHGVTRVLAHRRTAFQEMLIVESGVNGKSLLLDARWQSSELDEFIYHEALVHPAMVCHGGPRRVLVLGGGEGATLREVLRWTTVERAEMVDIDGEVVEACREHLPEMHQGSFDDPRTRLRIVDAIDFLARTEERWDVVIADLSDPIEDGPSRRLFTREVFDQVRQVLTAGGVFVVQAGSVAPVDLPAHARLAKTVEAVYPQVIPYTTTVPSFASPWGFVLAAVKPFQRCPDPATIDRLLAENTRGGFRMFDGATLLGLFHPPGHIRRAVSAATKIYTLSDPPSPYPG